MSGAAGRQAWVIRRPIDVGMRRGRLLMLITLLATFLALAGTSSAATSAPAEGLYDSCAGPQLPTVCVTHLERMRRAGFTVVLNYTALTYSNPQEVRTYMAAAHALGMKIIWALEDPVWWSGDASAEYPQMSTACGCHTNAALARYLVDLVKRSPATWGYYVGDETDPSQAAQANAFSAEVHRDDPGHPRLFVGIGLGAKRLIRPFASQADVLGADIYPIGQGQSPHLVGQIAAQLHSIARRGQRTAMVLQSFAFPHILAGSDVGAPGPWPTEPQMHEMLRSASAAHPSLILWWSYYKILESTAPRQHWAALKDAVFGTFHVPHTQLAAMAARLRHVPDLPAAAARDLGISTPYAASQLTDGNALRGFVRAPNSTASVGRDGRVLPAVIGCVTRCRVTVRYALLSAGSRIQLATQSFSLAAETAQPLWVSVRGARTSRCRLATSVSTVARGQTTRAALYQTLVRSA